MNKLLASLAGAAVIGGVAFAQTLPPLPPGLVVQTNKTEIRKPKGELGKSEIRNPKSEGNSFPLELQKKIAPYKLKPTSPRYPQGKAIRI